MLFSSIVPTQQNESWVFVLIDDFFAFIETQSGKCFIIICFGIHFFALITRELNN